jgi:hypothetical protein
MLLAPWFGRPRKLGAASRSSSTQRPLATPASARRFGTTVSKRRARRRRSGSCERLHVLYGARPTEKYPRNDARAVGIDSDARLNSFDDTHAGAFHSRLRYGLVPLPNLKRKLNMPTATKNRSKVTTPVVAAPAVEVAAALLSRQSALNPPKLLPRSSPNPLSPRRSQSARTSRRSAVAVQR